MNDSVILFLIAVLLSLIVLLYRWPAKCRICGHKTKKEWAVELDEEGRIIRKFNIWKCPKCNHSMEI